MKKKIVILLTAVCAVSLLGGCGAKKDDKDKTESKADYVAGDYVALGEYKGMEVNLESTYEVTEEDVQRQIEDLIAVYPAYEDSDKTTVENGDFVNIDYEGLLDGVAFDGGTAQNQILEIGSNSFIAGFEEGLIGANVGDSLSLELTFPEDYFNTEMAGKAVVFNVTVNKIVTKTEMTYDTITDQYVADNFSTFGYENVEALKNGIRDNMTQSNESGKEGDTRNAVLEKLMEICKVESLPEGLLDEEVKTYQDQMAAVLEESGMELSQYLENIGMTEEEYNTTIVDQIQNNLEMDLVLTAIADKENIEIDEEGFNEYLDGIVSSYGYESRDALLEEMGEDYVRKVYRNNKALDMVVENAVVTYGQASAE